MASSTIGWKCGLHLPVREELGEPVGARAVEQRLGRERAAPARRPGGSANRHARSEIESDLSTRLQALVPAGTGERSGPPRRCRPRRARWRGARPCRARTDGARAVARHPWRRWQGSQYPIGGSAEDRPASALTALDRVDAPSRATSTVAPNARCASRAPTRVELVGDVGDHEPLGAGARAVLAGLLRRQVAAVALALRARQRRLHHQQVGVARELDDLVGRAVVGAVGEPPAAVGDELDRVGRGEVRDRRKRTRSGPTCTSRPGRTRARRTRCRSALGAPRADDVRGTASPPGGR